MSGSISNLAKVLIRSGIPGFAVGIILCLSACSAVDGERPAAPVAAAASARPPSYQDIGDFIQSLVERRKLPGASILIMRDNKELYYSATGNSDVAAGSPIRRDTIFRIYSMTKPVTAAAMMILADDGKIRLDDPVSKYVPEFRTMQVYTGKQGDAVQTVPAREMTIENLLTHTAGFTYFFQFATPVSALYRSKGLGQERWRFDPAFGGTQGLAPALAALPLAYQPGSEFHYGLNLDVAGLVIERASGMRFGDFLRTRIFSPLGMDDTGFELAAKDRDRLASLYSAGKDGFARSDLDNADLYINHVAAQAGGSGLLSTIDDYAKFANMLAYGGTLNGRRILSEKSARGIMTNHLKPEQLTQLAPMALMGFGGSGAGLGFGYGGAVVTDVAKMGGVGADGEYLWGGAAGTTFWTDPANKVVVVFMTQLLPPREPVRDKIRTMTYQALKASPGR